MSAQVRGIQGHLSSTERAKPGMQLKRPKVFGICSMGRGDLEALAGTLQLFTKPFNILEELKSSTLAVFSNLCLCTINITARLRPLA